MKTVTYTVKCKSGNTLSELFQNEKNWHLSFGIAGWSKDPVPIDELLEGKVAFVGYVMEGFIKYFVTAQECSEGLRLLIMKTGSNRDEHLDWFIEQHLAALDCVVTKGVA